MIGDLNLTESQLVEICHRVVVGYNTVDGGMDSDRSPFLHNAKVAFIKAHRIITGSSIAVAKTFAEGPGRFAVYELQTRVEARKKANKEGIYSE